MKSHLILLCCLSQLLGCHLLQKGPQVGEVSNGFELKRIEDVEEIKGKVYFFEHQKTKTPLLYLSNSDDNKMFGVGFKTPPEDSTGVFHIFEHSVLAGSRKYPAKSLFFEVLGSSVKTFQNAMTFADKTFYPVSSTNNKDFENLVDIYLDSVFFPKVLENEKIFMREGWRYELSDKGELGYNGIVFSEMKGTQSSPGRHLYRTALKSVFSEGPYSHDSGGNPPEIPNLTYAQLKAVHARYYHPSNSYMLFYGNGSIENHLKIVDKDFLSLFNYAPTDNPITLPKPKTSSTKVEAPYPVSEGDSLEKKTFLSRSYVLPKNLNNFEAQVFQLFSAVLVGFESSPLKRALVDAEICTDVSGSLGHYQLPVFSLTCSGSEPSKAKRFQEIVDQTLAKVAKEGFDQGLIRAALNRVEFAVREFDTIHKGLVMSYRIFDSWLYGGDPLEFIRFEESFKKLRTQDSNKLFAELIAQNLTNNQWQSMVVLKPDTKMMDRLDQEIEARIKLADKTIDRKLLTKQLKEFDEWNQAPLTDQERAQIPKLKISDLDREAKKIPQTVHKFEQGVTLLEHPLDTQGIGYFAFYFDLKHLSADEISLLPILLRAIMKLDTQGRTYAQLEQEIYKVSGGFSQGIETFSKADGSGDFEPRYVFHGKALSREMKASLPLALEILTQTKFEQQDRIKQILDKYITSVEASVGQMGMDFASLNAKAKISPAGRFNNQMQGVPQLQFVRQLAKSRSDKELMAKLSALYNKLLNQQNLVISLACDQKDAAGLRSALSEMAKNFKVQPASKTKLTLTDQALFDGATLPGQVQYVSVLAKDDEIRKNYGQWKVLSKLASGQFLYGQIREQGGAYGGGLGINALGELSFYSYRDPRFEETLDVFQATSKFLTEMNDESKVESAILGSISDLDMPMTPDSLASQAVAWYFQGITFDLIQTYRDQIFAMNKGTLQAKAGELKKMLEKAELSVVGSEKVLKNSKKVKTLVTL